MNSIPHHLRRKRICQVDLSAAKEAGIATAPLVKNPKLFATVVR